MTKKEFGERLKYFRKAKEVSQLALGDAVGIPQSSIGGYEVGKSFPPLDDLIKIANYLEVSLDALCGRPERIPALRIDQRKLFDLLEKTSELVPDIWQMAHDNLNDLMVPILKEMEDLKAIKTTREPDQLYPSNPEMRSIKVSEPAPPYDNP